MMLLSRLARDRTAVACLAIVAVVILAGIFADVLPLNDPTKVNVLAKLRAPSAKFPLGTDHLGRCTLSRLVHGIRPTVLLSLVTMACTLALGTMVGLVSGYFRGTVDELFMRTCDILLSFPSQVMILAVVGVLGPGMMNVVLANIVIKWAWYARMIRSSVIRFGDRGYVLFSKVSGAGTPFILFRHILPGVASELLVLASLDMGWVILNISTLSFLGLGVQAPAPEWGAMLSEAKEVMGRAPLLMFVPGTAIMAVVSAFNLIGDSVRDAMDPKTL